MNARTIIVSDYALRFVFLFLGWLSSGKKGGVPAAFMYRELVAGAEVFACGLSRMVLTSSRNKAIPRPLPLKSSPKNAFSIRPVSSRRATRIYSAFSRDIRSLFVEM